MNKGQLITYKQRLTVQTNPTTSGLERVVAQIVQHGSTAKCIRVSATVSRNCIYSKATDSASDTNISSGTNIGGAAHAITRKNRSQ